MFGEAFCTRSGLVMPDDSEDDDGERRGNDKTNYTYYSTFTLRLYLYTERMMIKNELISE